MSQDAGTILSYLQLPPDYSPSPATEPIQFLNKHLRQLPPQLLKSFSDVISPKQRSIVAAIRNRRLKYTSSQPAELSFEIARRKWPTIWQGLQGQDDQTERLEAMRRGPREVGMEEREWADREFLGGQRQHVGKLGALLGEYAEEREAERVRASRRAQRAEDTFVPEEESDNDSDDGQTEGVQMSESERREYFERVIRERVIYGHLDSVDYDAVDWNDNWDEPNDREDEERWFDEEEEGE